LIKSVSYSLRYGIVSLPTCRPIKSGVLRISETGLVKGLRESFFGVGQSSRVFIFDSKQALERVLKAYG